MISDFEFILNNGENLRFLSWEYKKVKGYVESYINTTTK